MITQGGASWLPEGEGTDSSAQQDGQEVDGTGKPLASRFLLLAFLAVVGGYVTLASCLPLPTQCSLQEVYHYQSLEERKEAEVVKVRLCGVRCCGVRVEV